VTPILPLVAALAGNHAVGFSVNVPKAVVKLAELQLEFMFTRRFALVLQGGFGEPEFDRVRFQAKDLSMPAWGSGLQLRGYFTGDSSDGGAYAGAAGQYLRGTKSSMSLVVQAVGAGAIIGYKWGFELGPFIDLNAGAGYGYYDSYSDEEGADNGSAHSVFPFLNLNLGWAI
jgi:hypothetical protein